jgi:hypothetical protein
MSRYLSTILLLFPFIAAQSRQSSISAIFPYEATDTWVDSGTTTAPLLASLLAVVSVIYVQYRKLAH